MQMYLPALPSIARHFEIDAASAQLTFSAFVFAVGPAQLVYGPISDWVGRRNTALLSLGISLLGSFLAAVATDLSALIIARVIQGLGGAGGLVVSRAVLSDRYGAQGMASRLSMVITVIVVVPMVAPMIGGLLTVEFGWRSVFIAASAYIAIVWTLVFATLPETRSDVGEREPFVAGVMRLFSKPVFAALAVQSALTMSAFYVFISIVPYLLEDVLGYPPTAYGRFFIMLAGSYMTGTLISSRIASQLGMYRMIALGAWLALAASSVMVVLHWQLGINAWGLFGPMAMLAFANGLSSPSMQSAAVLQTKNYAGTASGVIGCLQQLTAGLSIQLVSLGGLNTAQPLTGFILGTCVIVALITLLLARNKDKL